MENEQSDNISKQTLDEQIEVALENAPVIKGLTIQQVTDITDSSWPTAKKHLGELEGRGAVSHTQLGRAKVYRLKDDNGKQPTNKTL